MDSPSVCWFCETSIPEGSFTCESLKCRQIEWGVSREQHIAENREAWLGASRALIHRFKDCSDFPWYGPWAKPLSIFYTLKAMLCVLFGRRGYTKVMYEASTIYHRTLYAGWEGAWLAVGSGLFTGWVYSIQRDSDWNM